MAHADLFECLDTLISIRRIRTVPVEEEKLDRVLRAAVKAPSAANTQPWEFIVIRHPQVKARVAEISRRGAGLYVASRLKPMPPERRRYLERSLAGMQQLPVLVVLCLHWQRSNWLRKDGEYGEANRRMEQVASYASVFPAMQNMLLAARGLGLGCWITMYHLYFEDELRRLLGIPEFVEPVAVLGIGYPRGRFKEARRTPYTQSLHREKW